MGEDETENDGETLVVTPTSSRTADVSDIVLRETDRVRLLFRPTLVDNANDRAACVRGHFVYQKKGKSDLWQDVTTESLNSLKKGEGFQLLLHAGELFTLMNTLGPLYRSYWQSNRIPFTRQRLMRIGQRLSVLLANQSQLEKLLEAAKPEEAIKTITGALRWAASSKTVSQMLQSEPDSLPLMSAALGVATLSEALTIWEENSANGSEEFWQEVLDRRAFLFDQLFHYPIVVAHSKAYVGGKRIDNQHGNIADFLARTDSTNSTLLIEIKTPTTPLLGVEYRSDVYPFSKDVNGAISQVLHYRSNLQANARSLRQDDEPAWIADECPCMVIAGNVGAELDTTAKKQSFERLRHRMHGVTVIGFDEMFGRAAKLLTLLRSSGLDGDGSQGA